MSRSTAICFDYQNKLKPCKSSCPDGMHLASHDPVCDPILRKWVVRQRCYTVKCLNVPHIQHAEVQSLCNEGQEHDGCDIHCSKGYEVATNTLKCQAVDSMRPLGAWVGAASCTPVSCGVPPDVEHTLHGSVAQHFPNAALYTCASGYSLDGLSTGVREFSVPCKADGSYDVSAARCQPITCTLADTPKSEMIQYSGESLPSSPVVLGPGEWLNFRCVFKLFDRIILFFGTVGDRMEQDGHARRMRRSFSLAVTPWFAFPWAVDSSPCEYLSRRSFHTDVYDSVNDSSVCHVASGSSACAELYGDEIRRKLVWLPRLLCFLSRDITTKAKETLVMKCT